MDVKRMNAPGTATTSKGSLPVSTPEAEGIPSSAILDFIDAVEQHDDPLDAVHSFMLLRHGKVVAEGWWEPYRRDLPHTLYSLSKSFTSSAVGLAIDEGLLGVDDPVLSFFPDDAPERPSGNLKAMTIRHLLSMSTGHHEDTLNAVWHGDDDNWPHAFLAQPVEHEPGTWFVYNTPATYMLSVIITHLTGESLLDYLRTRLFDPLGIENPTWDTDPQGRSLGGSGLHITTEDIARFGQMYLQEGMWQGRRILPAAWVREATRTHSDSSNTKVEPDWSVGYGYQFWRSRHNAWRGDGAFGQFCLVLPQQDAVVAMTSGTRDLQGVLDKVWAHLLPAFGLESLPEDNEAQAALEARLSSLSLPVVEGAATSGIAGDVSGRTWIMETNDLGVERVAFDVGEGHATMTVTDANGEHPVAVGYGSWLAGTSALRTGAPEPIAASGAWTAERTLELRVCHTESEVCTLWETRFAADGVSIDVVPNVSWTESRGVTLTGR
jgi:CubicO group peptidase (beta-lactamase class C family)